MTSLNQEILTQTMINNVIEANNALPEGKDIINGNISSEQG
jgi:hypothetical protein